MKFDVQLQYSLIENATVFGSFGTAAELITEYIQVAKSIQNPTNLFVIEKL